MYYTELYEEWLNYALSNYDSMTRGGFFLFIDNLEMEELESAFFGEWFCNKKTVD